MPDELASMTNKELNGLMRAVYLSNLSMGRDIPEPPYLPEDDGTAIPAAPRVVFPWSYGDLRAGTVTLTGYLAAVEDNGYCRVEVDGIGYHPKLADVRPATTDDDAPCPKCGCLPGERASDVEGDGTWALGWQCQCACHDADDDTSD